MVRRFATAVLTLGCMHASVVAALGLGELKLESFLNEPLTASVDLLNTSGLHEDQIRVRLATSEDFDKLGIDRVYFLTNITFEITVDERGNGKILLNSEDPVLEPYLDFIIEARWPTGRLLREYTVLVDSPAFNTANPVVSASQRVAETEGEPEGSKKKTETSASRTGTSVKTHKSDLAQGQMPQRNFGSNASTAPIPGDKYMIRRDETLWGIADRARPEGTSVHQTMLDIQRLNPDAFIGGNINRIKAGYIIYLPSSSEISSNDLASAQQEVQQQNQDWRDGISRDSRSAGPSLRISAEPDAEESTDTRDSGTLGSADAAPATALADSGGGTAQLTEQLASVEAQVETLQRIVTVKDDQIAALQAALAAAESGLDPMESEGSLDASPDIAATEAAAEKSALELAREAAAAKAATEPVTDLAPAAAQPKVAAKTPVIEEEGSNWLFYVLGLLVAAGLGVFFFLRRRGDEDDFEDSPSEPVVRDVFADVKLQDSEVDLDTEEPQQAEVRPDPELLNQTMMSQVVVEEPETADTPPEPEAKAEAKQGPDSRGYGERKHDEYASDEAGDALAEADIYIAYGRYPQAIDLLKTAITNEPRNPDYRVKLIELCAEMGNKDDALEQFAELGSIGDAATISRGEDILRSAGNGSNWLTGETTSTVDLAPPPIDDSFEGNLGELDLTAESGDVLEADFGELEIELTDTGEIDDDLDLSADFTEPPAIIGDADDEDLVFAEGGDEMSTKLDLARAYLDMGDEDGAKQILEEVAAAGSDEQKEQAKVLLERID